MAARQQVITPMRRQKATRDMSSEQLPRSHPRSTFKATTRQTSDPRDGLLPYIQNPEEFSTSRIVEYDSNWVLIKDLYPKATVHFLLLPRDPKFYKQHPCQAFKDEGFLSEAKNAAQKARAIAASELRRLHGSYSKSEQPRNEAMDSDDPPDELPAGRIWEEDIKMGIHACPSMNHMHIHIISRDNYSDRLKHRKHYQSFNSPFFICLDEFPLADDDERWNIEEAKYLKKDFECWRCGEDFGSQFKKLKEHLAHEFEEWRAE
jgi:aprataxin